MSDTLKPHSARFAAFALLVGLAACTSPPPPRDDAHAALFEDAGPSLGQRVTVHGYLVWEFENTNLFPDPGGLAARKCLPLLVRSSQEDLIAHLERLNGHYAAVTGTIIDPAPPGKQIVGVCKPIGLKVESVVGE